MNKKLNRVSRNNLQKFGCFHLFFVVVGCFVKEAKGKIKNFSFEFCCDAFSKNFPHIFYTISFDNRSCNDLDSNFNFTLVFVLYHSLFNYQTLL